MFILIIMLVRPTFENGGSLNETGLIPKWHIWQNSLNERATSTHRSHLKWCIEVMEQTIHPCLVSTDAVI